jgi:hypothetical protein
LSITVISVLPAPITHFFSKFMLLDALGRKQVQFEQLRVLAAKKLRAQDRGRRRQFEELSKNFKEFYGQKEAEKAKYQAKVKEKSQKRPHLQACGATFRFKRCKCEE